MLRSQLVREDLQSEKEIIFSVKTLHIKCNVLLIQIS